MKVTIERAALLKAMSRAQGVVERKNTIPILANVLLEADGDRVSLRATDLDIEVIEQIPAVVEQAGAVTAAAHLLHEIVRKLPEAPSWRSAPTPPRGGSTWWRAGRGSRWRHCLARISR